MLCQCFIYGYFLLRCIYDINKEQSSGACSGIINAVICLITCKFHILPDSASVIHYKDQSVTAVQGNHCFIMWEYCGTHKYTVRKVQVFKTLNHGVRIVTILLQRVKEKLRCCVLGFHEM